MKRVLLFLCLLSAPVIVFAKYCPTCLQTYQNQTTRGQAQLFYRWSTAIMNPKNRIKSKDFRIVFSKNIKMVVNGTTVAYGIPAAYAYFMKIRSRNPVRVSQLQETVAEKNKAAIQYVTITRSRGRKHRNLVLAILGFEGHKIISYYGISHAY